MPPRRANSRNMSARNENTAHLIPDQEVSNAEIRNAIQMLAQSMTNLNNWVHAPLNTNGGSAATRVPDFVEGDILREQAKENNKARNRNYHYSQQKSGGENHSQSQQKFSAPAPSSASVPSSKNRYDEKARAPCSKSQGSFSSTRTYPTCPKCGKNHQGKCLLGKEGCFGCGQSGHMLRDYPARQGQGGGNGTTQSTTS
ncbi:uncharacterized protein LOC107001495 [Solanum pennellii]|uniref:Uncharacterized protein LOC107001495 n=1 Tax=Solanum pennellii TaxID=28526 RepID=A0ABM1FCP0_SOLPN|nr:uncharacterized protein LOC107001495 [Solanum pennellii]